MLRVLVLVFSTLVAVPLAVYGAFAILYTGNSGGGNTYVKIAGREMDADVAGAGALISLSGSWRSASP